MLKAIFKSLSLLVLLALPLARAQQNSTIVALTAGMGPSFAGGAITARHVDENGSATPTLSAFFDSSGNMKLQLQGGTWQFTYCNAVNVCGEASLVLGGVNTFDATPIFTSAFIGGGGGMSSLYVPVGAATGIAATDTANIQTAITTACANVFNSPVIAFSSGVYSVNQNQSGSSSFAPIFTQPFGSGKPCGVAFVGAGGNTFAPGLETQIVVTAGATPSAGPVFSTIGPTTFAHLNFICYNECIAAEGIPATDASAVHLNDVGMKVQNTGFTDNVPFIAENFQNIGITGGFNFAGPTGGDNILLRCYDKSGDQGVAAAVFIDGIGGGFYAGNGIHYDAPSASTCGGIGTVSLRNLVFEQATGPVFRVTHEGSATASVSAVYLEEISAADNQNASLVNFDGGSGSFLNGITILGSTAGSTNPIVTMTSGTLAACDIQMPGAVGSNNFGYAFAVNGSGQPVGDCMGRQGSGILSITNAVTDNPGRLRRQDTGLQVPPYGPPVKGFITGNSFASIALDPGFGVMFGDGGSYGYQSALYQPSKGTFSIAFPNVFPPTALNATPTTGGSLANGTYQYVISTTPVANCNSPNTSNSATSTVASVTLTGGNNATSLSWTLPISGVSPILGFCVFRTTGGYNYFSGSFVSYFVSGGSTTTFTDTGAASTGLLPSVIAPLTQVLNFTPTDFSPNVAGAVSLGGTHSFGNLTSNGVQSSNFGVLTASSSELNPPTVTSLGNSAPGSANQIVISNQPLSTGQVSMFVTMTGVSSQSVTSVTDGLGNTYVNNFSGTIGPTWHFESWTACVTHGGTATLTVNYGSTGGIRLQWMAVTNANCASPVQTTSTGSGTGTSGTVSTITTSTANEMVIGFIVGPTSPSAGAGYTALAAPDTVSLVDYGTIAASGGTTTVPFSWSTSAAWSELAVALNPQPPSVGTLVAPFSYGYFNNLTINTSLLPGGSGINIGSLTNPFGTVYANQFIATPASVAEVIGNEGTCSTGPIATGVDVECLGDATTHSIQFSLNGAAFSSVPTVASNNTFTGFNTFTIAQASVGTQIVSGADYTNSTTTPSTVFSWTLPATSAAKTYRYSCDIMWESTNTTLVGPVFGVNISAAPTQLTASAQVSTAVAGTYTTGYLSNATTGSQTLITSAAAAVTSTNYPAKIWGTIEGAPTAGSTFIINAASTSGTTATLNIRRGSACYLN